MSTTAYRRDARDPADDFLLQKIFPIIPNFKNYSLSPKIFVKDYKFS
ncbi:MAG: hypothetical protein LBP59_08410 [Planctomycetaceae bacterium]|nr:hypothetical protein [Planctomycetaceae bacterium]